MGMAFLWLKYNLNYTKARALRVTVLLGYVEITITIDSISQYIAFVNGFVLHVDDDGYNFSEIIDLWVINSKVNPPLNYIYHCLQSKFSMSSLTFLSLCGIILIDKYNNIQSKFAMEGIYGNQTGSLFE